MGSAAGSGWLPGLAEAAARTLVPIPPEGDVALDDVPGRPGVAVFIDREGRTTLIAATADLRAMVKRRLGLDDPGTPGRVRHTLRESTASVVVIEAGSGLEADAIYLDEARARMPDTHRVVSERWRAWFVHVDPDAAHPQWSKTNLAGLVAPRAASSPRGGPRSELPPGLLIGPIADKDTAGRLIERVIDAFDLCRDHRLLVQAPRAAACAYKEMGRCPAPCDGSEPIDRYRDRTRAAAACLIDGPADPIRQTRERMSLAAGPRDFETAAALRQTLSRLESLDRPAYSGLAELRSWCSLFVLPSPRSGRLRCVLFAGATLGLISELTLDERAREASAHIARAALDAAGKRPMIRPTPAQIDSIAVVSRWLRAPKARRKGEAIPVEPRSDAGVLAGLLLAAARRVARPRGTAVAAAPHVEERVLEALLADPPPGAAAAGRDRA